jgi:hypothetical protein
MAAGKARGPRAWGRMGRGLDMGEETQYAGSKYGDLLPPLVSNHEGRLALRRAQGER